MSSISRPARHTRCPRRSTSRSAILRSRGAGSADVGRAHAARHQFAKREWLGEVVVGARVQPSHAVVDRVARRQHEHRRPDVSPAQRGTDRIRCRRKHHVEHDHVERAERRARAPRFIKWPLARLETPARIIHSRARPTTRDRPRPPSTRIDARSLVTASSQLPFSSRFLSGATFLLAFASASASFFLRRRRLVGRNR